MLFDVFQQYPTAMPVLATVGGLIIGSFLNVVIWRYPIMLRQQMAEFHGEMSSAQSKISLALPRSHCPHCQQTIRIRDNIPLFSWLMLKGRCRDCQAKISKRYSRNDNTYDYSKNGAGIENYSFITTAGLKYYF